MHELGLNESHFDIMCDHTCIALVKMGCTPDDITQVIARLENWKGAAFCCAFTLQCVELTRADCVLCLGDWA